MNDNALGGYMPGDHPDRWSAVVHTIVLLSVELLDLILRRRRAFHRAVVILVLVLLVGLAWRVPMPQLPELPTLPVPQLLH